MFCAIVGCEDNSCCTDVALPYACIPQLFNRKLIFVTLCVNFLFVILIINVYRI